MEVGAGDVLPLLVVAGILALTRLILRRGRFSHRRVSAAASGAESSGRLWGRIPSTSIDALVDVVLVALALAHVGLVASLLIDMT